MSLEIPLFIKLFGTGLKRARKGFDPFLIRLESKSFYVGPLVDN